MKTYLKNVAVHITAIILAAAAAAGFTFIQSIASQTGACEASQINAENAGLLGAALKAAHSGILVMTHKTII